MYVVYEYEFYLRTTMAETARRINLVFGKGPTTKNIVSSSFRKFLPVIFPSNRSLNSEMDLIKNPF